MNENEQYYNLSLDKSRLEEIIQKAKDYRKNQNTPYYTFRQQKAWDKYFEGLDTILEGFID
jgi:hypothetical protein